MSEADYYPAGAYTDSRAPYNQWEPDPKEFDVCVSQTLSKNTTVESADYYIEGEKGEESINTENVDFNKAYEEDHYSIIELLDYCKHFASVELERNKGDKRMESHLKCIIEECEGWELDESEVVED